MSGIREGYSWLRQQCSRAVTLMRMCRGHIRLRLSGASSIGKSPVLIGRAHFRFRGTTHIGDSFMVEGLVPVTIKVDSGAALSIGDRVYMNAGTSIEAYHQLIIGSDVLIGPYVSIIDDDRHQVEPAAVQYKGPTIVGDNVWLGRNVAVLPGVTIGDGAVIGVNSVVTRSIPPNSFAAGSPAQVIRKLDIPEGWLRT